MQFFKLQKKNIFKNDYFKMLHEAEYDLMHGKGLKILTPKQMFQRYQIALAQVIASKNASEKLLSEIRQITYSLYQEKEITRKVRG